MSMERMDDANTISAFEPNGAADTQHLRKNDVEWMLCRM